MSMIFCRGCGQQIHISAPTCPHCGAPNAVTQASSETVAVAESLPPGVAGWSWGAFLWNWVWAIGNKTWIGLLCLIPFVGFFMAFVLGFKGREWAWKNKEWRDLAHFNRVQRLWSLWGLIIILGFVGIGILAAVALPAYQDYVGRAVVADAQGKLVACKTAEEQAFHSTGHFSNDNLYMTCASNLSSKLLGYGKATGPRAIEITMFLNHPSIGPAAVSLFGEAGADGQLKWNCVSPDIPQKFLGSNCTYDDTWKLNTALLSPADAVRIAAEAERAVKQAEELSAKSAAGIPQQLRGRWATRPDFCANKGYPEGITTVLANGISGLEWHCELTDVVSSNVSTFKGNFNCSAEGQDTGQTAYELALPPDGLLIVASDGTRESLIRCKD